MLTTTIHPCPAEDLPVLAALRAAAAPGRGVIQGPAARPMFDEMRAAMSKARGVTLEEGRIGGVAGIWCRPADAMPGRRLLFLHGGGYMLGSAAGTANFGAQLAVRASADTFVADYRLAPENPFRASFDDAVAVYRGLAADADGPIAIAGQSAGGGLTLALLATLASDPSSPPPVAAAVMSPWVDLTLGGASYRTREQADPIFTREALAALADTYLGCHDATDPRASPIRADLTGLPPLRIDVGDDEVLLDDARALATRANSAGVIVELSVWTGMPHVFQAQLGNLHAAEQSFDLAGSFLRRRLK